MHIEGTNVGGFFYCMNTIFSDILLLEIFFFSSVCNRGMTRVTYQDIPRLVMHIEGTKVVWVVFFIA